MSDILHKYANKIDPVILKEYQQLLNEQQQIKAKLEDWYQTHNECYIQIKQNDELLHNYKRKLRNITSEIATKSESELQLILDEFEIVEQEIKLTSDKNDKLIAKDKDLISAITKYETKKEDNDERIAYLVALEKQKKKISND